MDLYIGNSTKQRQQFCYRVPEETGLRVQDIEIGTQVKISGDLSTQQIDAIIQQHRAYGLVPAAEAGKVKGFTGLCYSVGRPIQSATLELAIDANQRVLEARGKKLREEAAIAVSNGMEQTLGEMGTGANLREVEMSAVEEEPKGGYRDDAPFGEGVRVTREDARTTSQRRNRRGKSR